MKTYKIELTEEEAYYIQLELDREIRRLSIRLDKASEMDEIEWIDNKLDDLKRLAKKISNETNDDLLINIRHTV